MTVQLFGTKKSNDTKKAERFFKERKIDLQFFELNKKLSTGQLKAFIQKFGIDALIDKTSKAYEDSGLEHMHIADDALIEKLLSKPKLMKQPLIKAGKELQIGWDEQYWRDWHKSS